MIEARINVNPCSQCPAFPRRLSFDRGLKKKLTRPGLLDHRRYGVVIQVIHLLYCWLDASTGPGFAEV
jgi:hypothetical protein